MRPGGSQPSLGERFANRRRRGDAGEREKVRWVADDDIRLPRRVALLLDRVIEFRSCDEKLNEIADSLALPAAGVDQLARYPVFDQPDNERKNIVDRHEIANGIEPAEANDP